MFLHRSNSLEELVDCLTAVVEKPLPGLFSEELVVIQSAGMERYLSRELARRRGVAAGLAFPFPRAFIVEVLDAALGQEPRSACFERDAMAWSIYGQLADLESLSGLDLSASVRRRLEGDVDGQRRMLLAEQLAYLFDQYVVYRPRMILRWQKGHEPKSFQAELWRRLVALHGALHMAERCSTLLRTLSDEALSAALPARICVLGGPGLPPLFLQMLARFGQLTEVHLFAFSVCRQYFADALPQEGELSGEDEGFFPLLVNMGQVGGEFQHLMEVVGAYEEGAAKFVVREPKDALTSLQYALVEGQPPSPLLTLSPRDTSITVESCHSALREVEVLKERLLSWFCQDETLRPEDVVVLAPNIEDYSPLISAVFGAESDKAPQIPYRIADRSERYTNSVARAVLLAFSLFRSRFKASQVLDLLQLEPVRERYGFEHSDLERLQHWVSAAGIRWGVDAAHRTEYGLPEDDRNTWKFGIRRLLLGYSLFDDESQIFDDVVPFDDVPTSEAEMLGRFVDFCETLFSFRERLKQAPEAGLSLGQWQEFLVALLEALVVEAPDGRWDVASVREALLGLRASRIVSGATDADSEPGEEAHLVGVATMGRIVERTLDDFRPSTEFLTGGVTFCALLPLRTIPFRRVCVLGMSQGQFPRSDPSGQLDLMAHHRKPGDRSIRADDRHLFLEVILAARERLALFFVGRSVQDNSEKPPSVVIEDLCRAVVSLDAEKKSLPILAHPLQPFHPSYFSAQRDERLVSFDRRAFEGARALQLPALDPRPFFDGANWQDAVDAEQENDRSLSETGGKAPLGAPGSVEMSLAEVIRFWKDPSTQYLRAYGVYIDDEIESVEDREPIQSTGLERYLAGDRILHLLLEQRPLSPEIALRRGDLPVGQGGHKVLEEAQDVAEKIAQRFSEVRGAREKSSWSFEYLVEQQLSERVLEILRACASGPIPHQLPQPVQISDFLDNAYGNLLLDYSYGRLTAGRNVSLWVRHLAACVAGLGISQSRLIVRESPRKQGVVAEICLTALSREAAAPILRDLVQLSVLGKLLPLPFFYEASQSYIREIQKSMDGSGKKQRSRSASKSASQGPKTDLEAEDASILAVEAARRNLTDPPPAVTQVYRHADPLGLSEVAPEDYSESAFALLAELFFLPLIRAMQDDDSAPPALRVLPGGRS